MAAFATVSGIARLAETLPELIEISVSLALKTVIGIWTAAAITCMIASTRIASVSITVITIEANLAHSYSITVHVRIVHTFQTLGTRSTSTVILAFWTA